MGFSRQEYWSELPYIGKCQPNLLYNLKKIYDNTLLNNQQIIEEIKKEIKICIEMNENENTTTQNLWDTVKALLKGKFIALQAYLKKQEKVK